MTPSLTYQNQISKLKGTPFTKCRVEVDEAFDGQYRQEKCLMYLLYFRLCQECGCYPVYVDAMVQYNKSSCGVGLYNIYGYRSTSTSLLRLAYFDIFANQILDFLQVDVQFWSK